MGLKILHSADWHLDSPFSSLPAQQRETLRQWQRKLPDLLVDLCLRENCDLMLLSGDLFDGNASRESIHAMQQALERVGIPVFISPGNHDFCNPQSPWLSEIWPKNVHIFTGDLSFVDLPELDCRIYGAGYRSMDCPPLLEHFRAEGSTRYCVAVLHGDPLTLSSPCCPITAAQVRESGLDYLALGHIHKAGSFRAGNTLCAWPGCPMGRGWDETGEKGVCLVTLEETAELTQIVLDSPRFHDLTVSVEETTLDEVLPPVPTQDLYRVTLTGEGSADTGKIREQFAHLPLLELRDETHAPSDPWADIETDTLRGVYFRRLQEQLEAADEIHAEIIRLAADISRRLMDGMEVELP